MEFKKEKKWKFLVVWFILFGREFIVCRMLVRSARAETKISGLHQFLFFFKRWKKRRNLSLLLSSCVKFITLRNNILLKFIWFALDISSLDKKEDWAAAAALMINSLKLPYVLLSNLIMTFPIQLLYCYTPTISNVITHKCFRWVSLMILAWPTTDVVHNPGGQKKHERELCTLETRGKEEASLSPILI
jgi:hypothetical protein